jgi:hypothetical protein
MLVNRRLDNSQAPAEGAWLQLDMNQTEINSPAIPLWERTYLTAMATYGMYVGDTGSQGYFSLQHESGNQYTAVGAPNRWLAWAQGNQGQSGWSFYGPDNDYVGTWTGVDWSELRVLCQAQDNSCPHS